MHILFRVALAVAAVAGSTLPSQANCTGGRFSGPYLGLTAGIGKLDSKQSSPGEVSDASGHATRFVPGGILGYDIQCDRTVVGIVGDINFLGFKANSSWPDVGNPSGPTYLRSKLDSYETLRGKLGYTLRDDLLLYGTAGLAFANVSSTLETPGLSFTQTDKNTKTGFVWGGGLEFAKSDRIKWDLEALNVGLGKNSYDYTANAGCAGVCTGAADWKNSFWVARLGVTFTLGEAAVDHTPLK